MVKSGMAQCGTVCSERPLKALIRKALGVSCTHGVQGVECSNHSVPTIIENKKAQSESTGLFFWRQIVLVFAAAVQSMQG